MQFTKINLYLAVTTSLLFTGCNSGDDHADEMMPMNSAPVALSVDLITQADIAIVDMLSATDADGDPLSYSVATQPTMGMLTIDSNGQFTYQPNGTVTGSDSFSFTVSDNAFGTDTAVVNITIEKQVLGYESYSRKVFDQNKTDTPLPINGREFIQDVNNPNAYDDLLNNQ
ncbi:Ig-like domain-containing protein [uncultured Paraglaciecola sp.]|uniref:Ig-like domain-containing protein n=1 Tax=uncultured Paraglaciecola sp. TaxID=1765024 RepID=UPI0026386FD4|nr:Ig-like domain-containing protein [uncultured Paraglaciecola sp.]